MLAEVEAARADGIEVVSMRNKVNRLEEVFMRLVENLTLGAGAVGYRTESMHGAGSPQAQRIMIGRQSNINHKKELAKALAGVGKPWDKGKAKVPTAEASHRR